MYKRRVKIFLAIVVISFLGLGLRLLYLQGVKGQDYREQFERSLQHVELLPAKRGSIFDRTGTRPLAIDKACFDFCLHYGFLTRDRHWIRLQKRQIARELNISFDEAANVYERRAKRTWELARRIADANGVDLDESVKRIIRRVATIRRIVGMDVREQRQFHAVVGGLDEKLVLDGTVGAECRPSRKRWYPYGDLASHVIGFTGQVSGAEQKRLNIREGQADWLARMRSNYLGGDTLGKSGIEKMCEPILRGVRGYRRLKRVRSGYKVLDEAPAVHGRDVHLTLDMRLQKTLVDVFRSRGQTGSAVVLSLPEGQVLALVSEPAYDLNRYYAEFPALFADEIGLPLLNRAVQKRYPPGSTVKPIVALGALSAGVITRQTELHCSGRLFADTPGRWRCWNRNGHGDINVVDALKGSCNVFFYKLGNMMGSQQLGMWFDLFGFSDLPGTGLSEERASLVPNARWLRRTARRGFRPGDARQMAIGQGSMEVTPLHVANAMAAIARGGKFMTPILSLEGGPKRISRALTLTGAQVEAVHSGMHKVVDERGGTAYKYFHGRGVASVGIPICGKTGTAQTPPQRVDSNGNGRIDGGDRIVRSGDTAWCVGFAPYGNPQIAFAVVVEYVEGGGGRNAGPIALELIRACLKYGYIR